MMGPRAASVLNRIQLPSADDLGRWTPKERRDWLAELERDIRAMETSASGALKQQIRNAEEVETARLRKKWLPSREPKVKVRDETGEVIGEQG
jgi:hypothetical protein